MEANKNYRDVEDLDVFRRAYSISLKIHKASLTFPSIEQNALGNQIRRASKSICANLAEGLAKRVQSLAEFRRYLLIALGSADEMRIWVKYSIDLGYISIDQSKEWTREYREIAKILNSLYKKSTN